MAEIELLTEREKELIADIGRLIQQIKREVISAGPTYMDDVRELESAAHIIQRMILSMAAARRYPDLYRKLGGTIEWERKRSDEE